MENDIQFALWGDKAAQERLTPEELEKLKESL